jgi:hypothetical protein
MVDGSTVDVDGSTVVEGFTLVDGSEVVNNDALIVEDEFVIGNCEVVFVDRYSEGHDN